MCLSLMVAALGLACEAFLSCSVHIAMLPLTKFLVKAYIGSEMPLL